MVAIFHISAYSFKDKYTISFFAYTSMDKTFTQERRALLYDEIHRDDFIEDDFLVDLNQGVYGVNITCGFPLPLQYQVYEKLYQSLQSLDGVYVYPLLQTHITVMTIINFKQNLDSPILKLNSEHLEKLTSAIKPIIKKGKFDIFIDSPVLVRSAAFLPIYNPSGEIGEIRKTAFELLCNEQYDLSIPPAIHSTILRIEKKPSDTSSFIDIFDRISSNFSIHSAQIQEIYVTEEIKPYMRDAKFLAKIF